MNIVIIAGSLFQQEYSEKNTFIVETTLFLIQNNPEHQFKILTRYPPDQKYLFPANTEILTEKKITGGFLQKEYWEKVKLPRLLKKLNADVLISYDGICTQQSLITQILFKTEEDLIKLKHLKKANTIITTSNLAKADLKNQFKIPGEKITVVYPAAGKNYHPITENIKLETKEKYSDGKEFFLFNGSRLQQESLITLLKAFSLFKKRQQSSMQLLIFSVTSPAFKKNLETYKYRNDVKIIGSENEEQRVYMTASAYAVIISDHTTSNLTPAFSAMLSDVPLIVSKDSYLNEITTDAVLYFNPGQAKDLGEKMMLIYTNETLRTRLIEKAKILSSIYTPEKAAESIWQQVLKALP